MSAENLTPRGESTMTKPSSEKEQSRDRVRESHPSEVMKGEASIKQKSSATKLSRKDLPGRNSKQPVKVAHQRAPTVEVRNESISGIRVLQQQAKKRAVEQKPDSLSHQLPKRVSPKRKPSGKEEKFPTFYRVRDPRPPGERRHNSRRSLDMLHRMKITGKNLKCSRVRYVLGRSFPGTRSHLATAQDSLGLSSF
jgi:hypothetical protein